MSTDTVLGRIVAETRSALAERRRSMPDAELAARACPRIEAGDFRPFAAALARPGLSVIAEHKRSSPSAGPIRDDLELEDVVGAYERGGAAAVSVLTESLSFGGDLDDLRRARAATSLPLLRKDFIVDAYQLDEAVVAGADAVLLIVAALGVEELGSLLAGAFARGLAVLTEVHDAAELAVAVEVGAPIIGVNNRNLKTLEVDVGTTFALLGDMPASATVVAESGFRTRRELDALSDAGVDAVLIGEALMRAPDLEAACRRLTAPG
jgi:indole-3-glycerol phosphate synthase